MLNYIDFSGSPFHFIGIGGIGMSALAYVLLSVNCLYLAQIFVPVTLPSRNPWTHIFATQDASNLEFF